MNNTIVTIIAVVALLLGGSALIWGGGSGPQGPQGPGGEFSGAVGPESTNPYQCYSGVCNFYSKMTMLQNASTTCSYKTPNATTTPRVIAAYFRLASTTAVNAQWGYSTSAYATTTTMGGLFPIDASGQATITASTSPQAGGLVQFPPNTYINLKFGNATYGFGLPGTGNAPTGVCNFEVTTVS